MIKKVFSFVLLSCLFIPSTAQDARTRWVDSVFNSLGKGEKIGQLFMAPISSAASPYEIEEQTSLLKSYNIGSVYITGGGPLRHVALINNLRKISRTPLLVGISAEWGLAQMMDSVMGFQKPMLAAAWKNDSLFVKWAHEIARQVKSMDIQMNMAPNADHEIFYDDYQRYFSNDDALVARHAVMFANVMKEEGLLSIAKYLPRRQTENVLKDSTLILHLDQIDTIGFYAFRELIKNGLDGILTSYLRFSIQNEKEIIPANLSRLFISEILRKNLHFDGLVFAEVSDYKKTVAKFGPGDAELLAFETGNDILMNPVDLPAAIKKITKRIKKDKLLQQQLDNSVKKILTYKYNAGLYHRQHIDTDNLIAKLNSPELKLLKHELAEATVTIVKNQNDFLPVRSLENSSFACISIGKDEKNDFSQFLKKYAAVKTLSIKVAADTTALNLKPSDIVIIGIFPYAKDLEGQLTSWINRLGKNQKVVVVHFGNPFSLEYFYTATSLVAAYTDQDFMQEVVPQVMFGALPANAKLPVHIRAFENVYAIESKAIGRMTYTLPEAAGMDSRTLEKIDVIMNEAVNSKFTPGCQVLVIKDDKVVYRKSVGTMTYDNKTPIDEETIFDLASLTKVSATLTATMFMYEKGLIDINKKVSVYLPELKTTNKKDITIIDLLTHQSGLIPFLPLWNLTMNLTPTDSAYLPIYYSSKRDEHYPLQISTGLYASKNLPDSIWGWIVNSKMQDKVARTPFQYKYSDLGFMMMKHMSEKLTNQPMDEFLEQNIWEPLGASTTGFNPLDRFPAERIAPTEIDKIYRKSLVVGTVHDERAAMMGGVSGHAGLFSTINDFAKLGQMLLQEGSYAGTTYFKPSTIRLFTSKQFNDSRRGLGWDKPIQNDWNSPTSLLASPRTFGHTGFTGTCMWIDPEFNLVYIFFSNRVFPDRNTKLLNANIRSRIQDVIYRSIFDYSESETPASTSEILKQ